MLKDTEDVCATDLKSKQNIYFKESVEVTSEEIKQIEPKIKTKFVNKNVICIRICIFINNKIKIYKINDFYR